MRFNREELAWAAGFFDGEGTVGYRWTRRGEKKWVYPYLQVSQSGLDKIPDTLERFQRVTGSLGKIYLQKRNAPRQPQISTTRPLYFFRVDSFEKVQAIIAMLWNWLGDAKREQAKRTLIICVENSVRGHRND